ncbi:MAG: O-antigen ligase family protein [Amaricoccus sp.]
MVLITVAILATIFNDLKPLLPIGELSNDGFIYVMPLLLLYLLRAPGKIEIPVLPLLLALALLAVIVLGIAANYDAIARAYFKGRSGMSRVITQMMALTLGLLVTLIFYNLTRMGFLPAMSRAARLALFVMAGVGVLELASWRLLPGLTQAYDLLSAVIHANSGVAYAQRLRMTAFEVSWAAVMITLLFPFGMITLRQGWTRILYVALVLGLVVLTQSRTALLVIGAQASIFAWFSLSHRIDHMLHTVTLGLLAALVLLISPVTRDAVSGKAMNMIEYGSLSGPRELDSTENLSNVTRMAGINAGMAMFREHPVIGVGFGQFGFSYASHVRAADFRSWEVRKFVTDAEEDWPPAFSLHVRLLAETGLIGYAIWLLLLGPPLVRALRLSGMTTIEGRANLAVAMTLSGWLLLGMSIDTARFFGGWIALGVGFALPVTGSLVAPAQGRTGTAIVV